MKKILLAAFLTLSVLPSTQAANPLKSALGIFKRKKKDPVVWTITEGLKAPESAWFDASDETIYLSQIGEGGGKGKDGDGWISKISIDGKFIENKWVTGLNAPKGLRGHGGTLWAADIDQLVAIDMKAGAISQRIAIANAEFLNDVATGPDGSVYVSDMTASRVFRHKNGRTTLFATGEEIEHPNGLLVHRGKLYLGGWGLGIQDDFTTSTLGRLLSISLATGKRKVITPEPTGNLDGVEADGRGGFIVTDWIAGKVFRISGKGKVKELMSLPKGAADHAYLPDRQWLILPEMLENKLTAFRLK